jgi:hypothetical protein
MEITEPVILEIPQGKRRVRVELTSRADARDLIAAIATAMLRLPDDGEGHADSHGERGAMTGEQLDDALEVLSRQELELALHGAHGYCAAGVEQAVKYERRPMARCQVKPEPDPAAIPTADGEHVTCPSCGFRDGRHNPAGCRRQKQLANLAKQVARLSHPDASADRKGYAPDERGVQAEPEWDSDPKCDSLHPSLRVACEAHKPGLHIAPGFNEGDSDITWLRTAPLASVTPLRADEREPARIACPWVHPSKETPCIGGEHHGPPCRDLDGDEWVPGLAVSS